eukprot:g3520.t1
MSLSVAMARETAEGLAGGGGGGLAAGLNLSLPMDVFRFILSYARIEELFAMSSASRTLMSMASDNELWRGLYRLSWKGVDDIQWAHPVNAGVSFKDQFLRNATARSIKAAHHVVQLGNPAPPPPSPSLGPMSSGNSGTWPAREAALAAGASSSSSSSSSSSIGMAEAQDGIAGSASSSSSSSSSSLLPCVPRLIAFHPRGPYVVAAFSDGTVGAWDSTRVASARDGTSARVREWDTRAEIAEALREKVAEEARKKLDQPKANKLLTFKITHREKPTAPPPSSSSSSSSSSSVNNNNNNSKGLTPKGMATTPTPARVQKVPVSLSGGVLSSPSPGGGGGEVGGSSPASASLSALSSARRRLPLGESGKTGSKTGSKTGGKARKGKGKSKTGSRSKGYRPSPGDAADTEGLDEDEEDGEEGSHQGLFNLWDSAMAPAVADDDDGGDEDGCGGGGGSGCGGGDSSNKRGGNDKSGSSSSSSSKKKAAKAAAEKVHAASAADALAAIEEKHYP